MEAVDAQGHIVPISLTAATIFEDGSPTATFGIFTDLREQTRIEEALARAQEKLALTEKQAVVAELLALWPPRLLLGFTTTTRLLLLARKRERPKTTMMKMNVDERSKRNAPTIGSYRPVRVIELSSRLPRWKRL